VGRRLNPLTTKLVIPLAPDQFHGKETRLKTVYVLATPSTRLDETGVSIRQLSRREAFRELCRGINPYVSRPERLQRQFIFATHLASAIPVKSLSYMDGMDRLDLVRDAVLSDMDN
jgi:hypothetical protein